MLERVTRSGTRWLTLAGNGKEPMVNGPPVVTEDEFQTELGPLFKILQVREFRFTLDREDFRPLAWSILMERDDRAARRRPKADSIESRHRGEAEVSCL